MSARLVRPDERLPPRVLGDAASPPSAVPPAAPGFPAKNSSNEKPPVLDPPADAVEPSGAGADEAGASSDGAFARRPTSSPKTESSEMWSWAGWDGSPSAGPATSNAAESVLCSTGVGGTPPRPAQMPLRKACAETPDLFLP